MRTKIKCNYSVFCVLCVFIASCDARLRPHQHFRELTTKNQTRKGQKLGNLHKKKKKYSHIILGYIKPTITDSFRSHNVYPCQRCEPLVSHLLCAIFADMQIFKQEHAVLLTQHQHPRGQHTAAISSTDGYFCKMRPTVIPSQIHNARIDR